MNTKDNTLQVVHADVPALQQMINGAPDVYRANSESVQRCVAAGEALRARVAAEGMSDEMDMVLQQYLDKCRRTLKVMNERRSGVTRLMDELRKSFVSMETAVDAGKAGSVPALLQAERNKYAAVKRAEAERARAEAAERARQQQLRDTYRNQLRLAYEQACTAEIERFSSEMRGVFGDLELGMWNEGVDYIENMSTELQQWYTVNVPTQGIPEQEAAAIRQEVVNAVQNTLITRHRDECQRVKQEILSMLNGKRLELERARDAKDAAEAERIKQEMAQRDAERERAAAAERAQRAAEAAQASSLQAQAQMVGNLFDQTNQAAPVVETYQPRSQVKRRLVVDDVRGYEQVFALWWSRVGVNRTPEELAKDFKKMVTFCEKLANDREHPEEITSAYVHYENEVKAR